MAPDFLSNLNTQQLEAVTLPHQSALILAGAGSGKTRVLTTRIAWLLHTRQVGPQGILAVTFTNKAAKEMLTRISGLLPINPRGMWIGTFHGLCNRLLRTHHREANLPALFQILDSSDQIGLIKRVMKSINADDEKYPPKQLQYFINANKEEGIRSSQFVGDDDFSRKLNEFYAVYEAQCQREGLVDFAELLLRSYELLNQNQSLREHYRERFTHVLIDEFQDTNLLQYRWLQLLAGEKASVCAVGDDDQSIYGFRGANTGNMQRFERDFRVNKIIKLEQNYRSHGNILDAANALICNNHSRLGKNLWTEEGAGELIRVYEATNDLEESRFIVEEVQSLVAENVLRSEIAVLYRSNAQSRVIEHALFSAGIPYRVYGGLRFFERQEIKHALAYLRLVANPDDDSALLRVINFPTRGIGTRSIEQLQEIGKIRQLSLWQTITSGAVEGRSVSNLNNFVQLINGLRTACENLPLSEIIEHTLHQSGLIQHYQLEKEGAERLENLEELINAGNTFLQEQEDNTLAAFLAHAALESGERQAGVGESALQLMTVHSAKGLEFHTVFVSGLEEGLFPHENSASEANGLEEERRLMYVAITRARRRLYLSFAQTRMLHGQSRYSIASRFLSELPHKLLKWLSAQIDVVSPSFTTSHTSPPVIQGAAWRIGQNVVHPKFGMGVIVNAEGRGDDARLQINFSQGGLKWLAVEYAKLIPI